MCLPPKNVQHDLLTLVAHNHPRKKTITTTEPRRKQKESYDAQNLTPFCLFVCLLFLLRRLPASAVSTPIRQCAASISTTRGKLRRRSLINNYVYKIENASAVRSRIASKLIFASCVGYIDIYIERDRYPVVSCERLFSTYLQLSGFFRRNKA